MTGDNGLITIASHHSVRETIDRAEAIIKAAGNRVFARVDHQAGAVEVGLTMAPMELVIFGNPRGGTPLMLAAPTFGIDLPLKLLAWQDGEGRVWLTYDSLGWIAARHGTSGVGERLAELEAKVRAVAEKAAAP
jgi:uncharacterized protein (DUF302 family)